MEGIKWNNVPNTKSCAVDLYVALLPQHTTYNLYVINKHLHIAASSLAAFPCSVPFQPMGVNIDLWTSAATFDPQVHPWCLSAGPPDCFPSLLVSSPPKQSATGDAGRHGGSTRRRWLDWRKNAPGRYWEGARKGWTNSTRVYDCVSSLLLT